MPHCAGLARVDGRVSVRGHSKPVLKIVSAFSGFARWNTFCLSLNAPGARSPAAESNATWVPL